MPSRGYRKGISDAKTAAPHRIHTRLSESIHSALRHDAKARSTNASDIIRALVTAHYTKARLEIPQPRGLNNTAVHELARIGNNLNQIARQANTMHLHLLEHETKACLSAVLAAIAKL